MGLLADTQLLVLIFCVLCILPRKVYALMNDDAASQSQQRAPSPMLSQAGIRLSPEDCPDGTRVTNVVSAKGSMYGEKTNIEKKLFVSCGQKLLVFDVESNARMHTFNLTVATVASPHAIVALHDPSQSLLLVAEEEPVRRQYNHNPNNMIMHTIQDTNPIQELLPPQPTTMSSSSLRLVLVSSFPTFATPRSLGAAPYLSNINHESDDGGGVACARGSRPFGRAIACIWQTSNGDVFRFPNGNNDWNGDATLVPVSLPLQDTMPTIAAYEMTLRQCVFYWQSSRKLLLVPCANRSHDDLPMPQLVHLNDVNKNSTTRFFRKAVAYDGAVWEGTRTTGTGCRLARFLLSAISVSTVSLEPANEIVFDCTTEWTGLYPAAEDDHDDGATYLLGVLDSGLVTFNATSMLHTYPLPSALLNVTNESYTSSRNHSTTRSVVSESNVTIVLVDVSKNVAAYDDEPTSADDEAFEVFATTKVPWMTTQHNNDTEGRRSVDEGGLSLPPAFIVVWVNFGFTLLSAAVPSSSEVCVFNNESSQHYHAALLVTTSNGAALVLCVSESYSYVAVVGGTGYTAQSSHSTSQQSVAVATSTESTFWFMKTQLREEGDNIQTLLRADPMQQQQQHSSLLSSNNHNSSSGNHSESLSCLPANSTLLPPLRSTFLLQTDTALYLLPSLVGNKNNSWYNRTLRVDLPSDWRWPYPSDHAEKQQQHKKNSSSFSLSDDSRNRLRPRTAVAFCDDRLWLLLAHRNPGSDHRQRLYSCSRDAMYAAAAVDDDAIVVDLQSSSACSQETFTNSTSYQPMVFCFDDEEEEAESFNSSERLCNSSAGVLLLEERGQHVAHITTTALHNATPTKENSLNVTLYSGWCGDMLWWTCNSTITSNDSNVISLLWLDHHNNNQHSPTTPDEAYFLVELQWKNETLLWMQRLSSSFQGAAHWKRHFNQSKTTPVSFTVMPRPPQQQHSPSTIASSQHFAFRSASKTLVLLNLTLHTIASTVIISEEGSGNNTPPQSLTLVANRDSLFLFDARDFNSSTQRSVTLVRYSAVDDSLKMDGNASVVGISSSSNTGGDSSGDKIFSVLSSDSLAAVSTAQGTVLFLPLGGLIESHWMSGCASLSLHDKDPSSTTTSASGEFFAVLCSKDVDAAQPSSSDVFNLIARHTPTMPTSISSPTDDLTLFSGHTANKLITAVVEPLVARTHMQVIVGGDDAQGSSEDGTNHSAAQVRNTKLATTFALLSPLPPRGTTTTNTSSCHSAFTMVSVEFDLVPSTTGDGNGNKASPSWLLWFTSADHIALLAGAVVAFLLVVVGVVAVIRRRRLRGGGIHTLLSLLDGSADDAAGQKTPLLRGRESSDSLHYTAESGPNTPPGAPPENVVGHVVAERSRAAEYEHGHRPRGEENDELAKEATTSERYPMMMHTEDNSDERTVRIMGKLYRLCEPIGKGGYGQIFRAERLVGRSTRSTDQPSSARKEVAIKESLLADRKDEMWVRKELQALGSLPPHPNIIRILGTEFTLTRGGGTSSNNMDDDYGGDEVATHWVVMELFREGNLAQYISSMRNTTHDLPPSVAASPHAEHMASSADSANGSDFSAVAPSNFTVDSVGQLRNKHAVGHMGVSTATILDVACQICSAISHLHAHRIIHRDIKPQNILIDTKPTHSLVKSSSSSSRRLLPHVPHGPQHSTQPSSSSLRVVLTDFGVCRQLFDDVETVNTVVGTPAYMAPECITGRNYSYAVDSWSLGCVLFVMATGKVDSSVVTCFGRDFKTQEQIDQHLRNSAELVDRHCSVLEYVIGELLRLDPRERMGVDACRRHLDAERIKRELQRQP